MGLALVLVGLAACGSADGGEADGRGDDPADATGTTAFAAGTSGAFAVTPVPEGFEVARAYRSDDQRALVYAVDGDEDEATFTVASSPVDPSSPELQRARELAREGATEGVTTVEVHGHEGYRGPLTDEGQVYGDLLVWFERPDLAVEIRAPFSSGVDVEELAARTYEISEEAFDQLVLGTTGGGGTGAPVEALRGQVDGDTWVLTAVPPEGYPTRSVDRRVGCAQLSFRGESATTCSSRVSVLSDAREAMLGGVNFMFGVLADGGGEVVITQPENLRGTPVRADAVVLPSIPDRTWFVASFAEVCDRVATSSGGEMTTAAVPAGHPHRNTCS